MFRASKTGLSPSIFPAGSSKAVSQLQFFLVHASVISYVAFVWSLFLISSFDTLGKLCFVVVAFPVYLHVCFYC